MGIHERKLCDRTGDLDFPVHIERAEPVMGLDGRAGSGKR
jgi:hypothetical protein